MPLPFELQMLEVRNRAWRDAQLQRVSRMGMPPMSIVVVYYVSVSYQGQAVSVHERARFCTQTISCVCEVPREAQVMHMSAGHSRLGLNQPARQKPCAFRHEGCLQRLRHGWIALVRA